MDLGQIFTKKDIASYMVNLLNLPKNANILDPCFGEGAFLLALLEKGFSNIDGYEIDSDLFRNFKTRVPLNGLYNRDFLLSKSNTKYDSVIMNPPYIRHEKINDLAIYGITKEILRKEPLYCNLPSNANLYMYFIVKAIYHLKHGGQLVVIFPNSWLRSKSGQHFKKILESKTTLLHQLNAHGRVFEKKALVDVVILHLKKGKFDCEPCFTNLFYEDGKISDSREDNFDYTLGFDVKFEKYSSVRRGLTTGFNQLFINPTFSKKTTALYTQPIISSPKSLKGYTTENGKEDRLLVLTKGMSHNSEVQTFIKNWKDAIILLKHPKTLYNKIIGSRGWFEIKPIESNGLIFSYFIRDDIKFMINSKGVLVRDNFYIIKPKIDIILAFALFNNLYTYFQLEMIGKKYGAGLLKIQRYDIENLYFPDITKLTQEDRAKLVEHANNLIRTSDYLFVEEISKIISKYSSLTYEKIHILYTTTKQLRLEGKINEHKSD